MALAFQCEQEIDKRGDLRFKYLTMFGNVKTEEKMEVMPHKQFVVANLKIEEGEAAKNAWATVVGNRIVVMVGQWLFVLHFGEQYKTRVFKSLVWSYESQTTLDREFRINKRENLMCAKFAYAKSLLSSDCKTEEDESYESLFTHATFNLQGEKDIVFFSDLECAKCPACEEQSPINNFEKPENRVFLCRRVTDTHFQVAVRGPVYLQQTSCGTRGIPPVLGKLVPEFTFSHSKGTVEKSLYEGQVVEEGPDVDGAAPYVYSSHLPKLIEEQIKKDEEEGDESSDDDEYETVPMDDDCSVKDEWYKEFYLGPIDWVPSSWNYSGH